MRKAKFYRRWKRRFLAGVARVENLLGQCLRNGEPDIVHDLRVALRRTRLLALVGTPVLGKVSARDFRQWALKLATALGPVRDYDVTLEWLKAHSPGTRERLIRQRRARTWREARLKAKAVTAPEWKELRKPNSATARPGRLREKFHKVQSQICDALDRDAPQFDQLDAACRHEFRRALRRLRYLRELELSRREQKSDRRLKRLIAFQETLGEAQNCAVVRAVFSQNSAPSPAELVNLAKAQEQRWLARAQRHLAAFMRARAAE